MKIIERFLAVADDYASKVALWDGERSYTYEELKRAVNVRAHHIMIATSNDKVGLLLANGVEFVTSYFGALLTDKTPVPLSYFLSPKEILYVVSDAGLDCVVTSKGLAPLIAHTDASGLLVEKLATTATKLMPVAYTQAAPYAALLYTSGSEGSPKGVLLSDLNLLANLAGCRRAIGFDDSFVVLGTLPLFHTFALTTTMLLPLLEGATSVYTGKFDPGQVVSAIRERRVSIMMSIPSLYRAMLARSTEQAPGDTPSLTHAISGGEPLPESVRLAFGERFGVALLDGYGLTETSPVVSVNTLAENRSGSVGKPLHNVRVKIIGPDGGGLGPDTEGEICVGGLSVMEGYYNRPDLARRRFTDERFLRTGDVGKLDRDGFLYVTGRLSEMMIVGGENVWPGEIEDVISGHEAVLDVGVVGVPDETRGEVPKAFVVPAGGRELSEQEIKDWCRKSLPRHKIPRHVEFRRELPRSASGKLLRRQLRTPQG